MTINPTDLGCFLLLISVLLTKLLSLKSFSLNFIQHLSLYRTDFCNNITVNFSTIGNTISVLFIIT